MRKLFVINVVHGLVLPQTFFSTVLPIMTPSATQIRENKHFCLLGDCILDETRDCIHYKTSV